MSNETQYICHRTSSLSGTERKNHKYVARVLIKKGSGGKPNQYQYFYDNKSYQKYLNSQKKTLSDTKTFTKTTNKDKASEVLSKFKVTVSKKQVKDNVSKGKDSLSKLIVKATKSINKAADKTKDKVSKTTKEISKDVKKSVDKVENKLSSDKLNKTLNKTTKEISKEVKMGKTKVDKMLDRAADKVEKLSNKPVSSLKSSKEVAKGKEHVKKQIDKRENGLAVIVPARWIDAAAKFVSDVVYKASNKIEKMVDKITDKDSKESGYAVTLPNGKSKYFKNESEYEDYQERLEYQKNEPDFMKDVPDISHNDVFTKFEDQEKINEEYDPWDMSGNTNQNCCNCSVAYELRRRGYDVEAKTNGGEEDYNGRGDRFYDYFEDAEVLYVYGDGKTRTVDEEFTRKVWDNKITDRDCEANPNDYLYYIEEQRYSAKSIEKAITSNNPPGSRGMIDVDWKNGGAHSIVYEVDKNGKVTIRDSQTYDEYSLDELSSDVSRIRICRTDNLELKEDILHAVQPNEDKKRKYYLDKGYAHYY